MNKYAYFDATYYNTKKTKKNNKKKSTAIFYPQPVMNNNKTEINSSKCIFIDRHCSFIFFKQLKTALDDNSNNKTHDFSLSFTFILCCFCFVCKGKKEERKKLLNCKHFCCNLWEKTTQK